MRRHRLRPSFFLAARLAVAEVGDAGVAQSLSHVVDHARVHARTHIHQMPGVTIFQVLVETTFHRLAEQRVNLVDGFLFGDFQMVGCKLVIPFLEPGAILEIQGLSRQQTFDFLRESVVVDEISESQHPMGRLFIQRQRNGFCSKKIT